MGIDIYGKTIQGKRRKQEDDLYYQAKDGNGLAVVCDGMGGLDEGDWASYIAVKLLKKHFNRIEDWDDIPKFLDDEMHHLDDVICKLVDDKNEQIVCGTTIVSAIVHQNKFYWSSVGDSRVYLYTNKNRKLTCLTRAHNYYLQLEEELKKNRITKEEFAELTASKTQSDSLISFLGIGNLELCDVSKSAYELLPGDVVILCSDGVFQTLSDDEIVAMLSQVNMPVRNIVNSMIEKIQLKDKKKQDNASLIMMRYGE
ncbi:MAG: serine/threonine-protein phosphatase [Lachnospiraceae bacterium]|nr:serine/threonine-protein phosphatase [Lachnospiraceae bacterium]